MALIVILLKMMNLLMEVIYVEMMENGQILAKNIIVISVIILINIIKNVKEIFVLMTLEKKKFI